MTEVWDEFLTDRDRKVFAAAGYGKSSGYRSRPALLIIDISYGFVGDQREYILDSIMRFRSSCGEEGWEAMERLVPVIEAARSKGLPIIYTTSDERHPLLKRASWGTKNKRVDDLPPDAITVNRHAIPDLIAPREHEIIICKQKPSAFFGTPLIQYLVTQQVNQLLCCGSTTSGCVRATVVDGFSYNYQVAVIKDCTFDRGQASHAISLFDMQQKYADVISSADVLKYINSLPNSLFINMSDAEIELDTTTVETSNHI